ncbi:hypothetical protein GOODEAATRI_000420, partial [Goodea atripinnis]
VQVFGLYTREGFHESFDCPIKGVKIYDFSAKQRITNVLRDNDEEVRARPRLDIIQPLPESCDEISSDALSVRFYQDNECRDYRLGETIEPSLGEMSRCLSLQSDFIMHRLPNVSGNARYTYDQRYDRALEIYLRLRHKDVYQLIHKHNLFSSIEDKIVLLMEFDKEMIMEELEDVDKAIEFAKEQDDAELWEDLICYSIDKPRETSHLLRSNLNGTTLLLC